jgi:hypothetical protein
VACCPVNFIFTFTFTELKRGPIKNWGQMGVMGRICVKDWFKPVSPVFLSWLLRKLKESNAHGRFFHASVFSQVTPLFRVI